MHDSKRDQLLLHGGGKDRDELWAFDLKANRWRPLQPKVAAPASAAPPVCNREAVYIPGQAVLLTYGPSRKRSGTPAPWVYRPAENTWRQVVIDLSPGVEPRRAAGQNRALVYDPKRDLVLMVLGEPGDAGKALVFALRYQHNEAKFVERGE